MSEPTLVYLSYSPWSIRARWALAHHRIPYRKVPYTPMLSEPWLRWKTRQWTGRVTVPVWIDGDRVLTDSLDIARETDRLGHGTPLFPKGRDAEIEDWNALGETMQRAARVRIIQAAQQDPDLLDELVPPALRRVRPVAKVLGRVGQTFFIRKYRLDTPGMGDLSVLREGFDRLRDALGDGQYLLGEFSYADIVMALTVTSIEPPPTSVLPVGDVARKHLGDAQLAREYPELVKWRDQMLARHHPKVRAKAGG